MVALADHRLDGRAREAWLSKLDNLLPSISITTTEYALKKRKLPGPTGKPVDWDLKKTPYIKGPQDALDTPGVRVVALQSAARWGKTVAAENKVMRHWTYGPSYNVLWYMQDEKALADYVDERFEWMLENHDDVAAKIDWSDPRNGRFRKEIGDQLLLMRAATPATTRAKAAPIIIVDEIDSYQKRVRNAIDTLIENRQREFGSNAIAYICSHPDAAPHGVAGIIADGLRHLWWWRCPKCKAPSSPCQGAEHRMVWNVGELMKKADDMDRLDFLDMIEREARLVCPHCRFKVDEAHRLPMSNMGVWLQPHQKLLPDGKVKGEPRVAEIMGFVGHGTMSPFVNLGKLARKWAAAKRTYDLTTDDTKLKEETVKSLGEEYGGAEAETIIEPWNIVKGRLQSGYKLKTCPPGVMFLTAFVDVQGDRFEVRVVGWDLAKKSWLVDVFAIKQPPRDSRKSKAAFDNIDPANRLSDWGILEDAVLNQVYVTVPTMHEDEPLYLPIAKTLVNAAGSAGDPEHGNRSGVSGMARVWLYNLRDPKRPEKMMAAGLEPRPPVDEYKVTLFVGSASIKSDVYGKPYPVMKDEAGKQTEIQVFERAINVHQIKRLIAKRMKIADPSPGRMHIPYDLSNRYVRELVAEKLIDDQWIASGRNETWDGWVACEAARYLCWPDRDGLWVVTPEWARARPLAEYRVAAGVENPYERLLALNRDLQ